MDIGVGAEHDGSERPHEEPCTKSHQRQHQRDEWDAAREESIPNGGGVVAKNHEVVHLQEISAGDTHHRPDPLFALRRIWRSECAIFKDRSGRHVGPSDYGLSASLYW